MRIYMRDAANYLFDPHNGWSQIGYLFTCGGTVVLWRYVKQIITTTSSNHAKILALHKASHKGVWLRSITCTTNLWFIGKNEINHIWRQIVHALLNWKKHILKETEQNIFFQNSFSLMIFK